MNIAHDQLSTALRDGVPPIVVEAFASRATISLSSLAKLVGADVKTLNRAADCGILPVHIKGTGLVRRHKVCTISDVAAYFRNTGAKCPSSASPNHPTINSTSKSKVIVFPGQQSAGMNVTRRSLRKRAGPKPKGSSKTA